MRRTRLSRKLLLATGVLGTVAGLVTAAAATSAPPSEVSPAAAPAVHESAVPTVERSVGPARPAVVTSTPDTTAPVVPTDTSPLAVAAPDVALAAPQQAADPERLRLRCAGVAGEGASGAGIACGWTASSSPRFVGYRLLRGDGDTRAVVLRTDDRRHTRHLDRDVEPGVEYRYAVQALGPGGVVIGQSEPVVVRLPERPREQITLACERATTGGQRGIACRWWEATRDDAVGYVLVRSIDGGPRERIFRTPVDGPNRYVDAPLRPGHRYTYAVLVLDADGQVIGEGGPVTVGWPADPPAAPVPQGR